MMNQEPKELSFLEHLDELRERLIKAFLAVFVASCLFYVVIDQILVIIVKPVGPLIFTSPPEAFMARLLLTLLGGFLLASPIVFYQIWQFVSVGLTPQERRHIRIFAPVSCLCFLLGAMFGYYIMVPIALKFLLSFSNDVMVPMITVSRYISFIGTLILACGAIFELPLVMLFLSKIGIATPEFLRQKRRHAVVLILVISALLTPPDVITQLMMAVPLILLYECGILFSRLVSRP